MNHWLMIDLFTVRVLKPLKGFRTRPWLVRKLVDCCDKGMLALLFGVVFRLDYKILEHIFEAPVSASMGEWIKNCKHLST